MRGRHLLALSSVLLVAACLRPAITSVGPLLVEIGADTGLGGAGLGLLGAVPLLMFALCSPLATRLAGPRGIEVAVLWSLVLLVTGMAVRSVGGMPGLWIGTAVAGGAIAVANVLTPALVKRDFVRPAMATAAFATTLSAFAALASGSAVPLAEWLGGWRAGLLAWAVLPVVVIPWWFARIRIVRSAPTVTTAPDPRILRELWRSPIAWQVSVFFGLQSATFYTVVTWLPTIERAHGISDTVAGLHLLVYQIVGSACGLAIGVLMERRYDQRLSAVLISFPVVVAMLGLAFAPGLALLWVVVAAAGAGSALSVALSLIVLRTTTSEHTAALSAMAQSIGYLIAAMAPLAAGILAAASGWRAVLITTAGIAAVQTVLSLWAGQPSRYGEVLTVDRR